MNVKINLRRLCLWGSLTLAAVLGLEGCGDPDSPGNLTLHPVEGTVLLDDGKPLGAGRVILVSRERGMEFEGRLDASGIFHISSNLGDGVPEGSYRIRIEPDEASLPQVTGRSTPRKAAFPFPVRYSNEDTSDLTATIGPGENKLEPFHLLKAATRKTSSQGPARAKG